MWPCVMCVYGMHSPPPDIFFFLVVQLVLVFFLLLLLMLLRLLYQQTFFLFGNFLSPLRTWQTLCSSTWRRLMFKRALKKSVKWWWWRALYYIDRNYRSNSQRLPQTRQFNPRRPSSIIYFSQRPTSIYGIFSTLHTRTRSTSTSSMSPRELEKTKIDKNIENY